MENTIIISFSGGRTSAFMTYFLLHHWSQRDSHKFHVLFANTGKERPETLDFINKFQERFNIEVIWLEGIFSTKKGVGTTHRKVTYETADRSGQVYEEYIKVYGIPNTNAPTCSREMKRNVIRSYIRRELKLKKYKIALGIRSDEPKRLNWEKAKRESLLYFAEVAKVTKHDVNHFWSKQSFDLALKSYEGNCDLCFKKSIRKLMTIARDNPELTEYWSEMEAKYENIPPINKTTGSEKPVDLPLRFFRDNLSMQDIIEDAKLPFKGTEDESHHVLEYNQPQLFDLYLDSNGGCVESCEAF